MHIYYPTKSFSHRYIDGVAIANRLNHIPSYYLKKMYFDAISYDNTALEGLVKLVGSDRIMFGTGKNFPNF